MNLAQARRLARLLEQAQPILPLYHDEGEPRPTARASLSYEGDDLSVRLWSVDDCLAHFPERLFVDEDGLLYLWDDERSGGEEKTPCDVEWRYGDPTKRSEQYRRFLEARPTSTVTEDAGP